MRLKLVMSFVCAGAFMCLQPALGQGGGSMNTPMPGVVPGQAVPVPGLHVPPKADDQKFAKDAALGGMIEVELGKLAAQKASRDDIKRFARKMVDDYTKSNSLLVEVARRADISIPSELDSKHRSRVEKLSKLSGEAFDKAFMQDQLKHRQAEVGDFRAEGQIGVDPTVKAFATYLLPALEQDLKLVKSLNKSENSAKESGG
jgi:putative membrane protein